MSTAVFKRLPVAAAKMQLFERVKIYRDCAGAAPKVLKSAVSATPLHKALAVAVQEITFLESETLQPQPVNLNLKNVDRDTDPYLSPVIRDLSLAYFGTK